MNIKVNDVLKSANTKFAPENKRTENKENDDKGESFLRSFNKLIERKRVKAKRLEDKSQGVDKKIDKDEAKDISEHLNTNYLVQSYSEEKTLNSQLPIGSIENILIDDAEAMKELFQEESFNLDSLMTEIEAELLDLNLDGKATESLLDIDVKDDSSSKVNNLNFSIEEAKANLTKALNKETNKLETEEIKPLQDNQALEQYKALEDTEDSALKSELVSKESLISKPKEVESSKTIDQPKESMSANEKNSILKLGSLEETTDKAIDPLDVEDTNTIKEDKAMNKESLEAVEENTSVEEAKFIDTNILFNRIQNSIFGFEETNDSLSTENIQNLEDSMIKFMKVSKEGDASVMRVRLYPEELGSIDISLKLDKGKLIADIIVASDKIKDMFLNSSSILNRNLIEQNIPIKNINIRVNDAFNNLENASGETGHGESGKDSGQGQNTRRDTDNDLNNNPMDNMRIESINRRNVGSKGLNILV